jgi:hypothetical protein
LQPFCRDGEPFDLGVRLVRPIDEEQVPRPVQPCERGGIAIAGGEARFDRLCRHGQRVGHAVAGDDCHQQRVAESSLITRLASDVHGVGGDRAHALPVQEVVISGEASQQPRP